MPETRAPSGEALSALFKDSRQPMWVLDARALRFIDVNPAALRFYGYSREEFLRLGLSDLRPGAGFEVVARNIRSHQRPGLPWIGVSRHRKKSGALVDVGIFSFPGRFRGRPAWLASVVPDRRWAAATRVGTHPQLFDTRSLPLLFKRNPQPMWVFDAETLRFLAVNDAAVKLYGYSRRRFLDLTVADIRPRKDRAAAAERIRRNASRRAVHAGLYRHLKSNGDVIDVDVRALDILFAGRRARLAMLTDVTEKRLLEERRAEAERRLESVVSNAPVILFALDRRGVFTVSKGQGLAQLGLKPGEVVGRSVFDIYRGHPTILGDARRALRGQSFSSVALVAGRAYETRWTPMKGENGRLAGVIGVATDVTEQKQAEQGLRDNERRFRDLYSKTPVMMHSIDLEGRIVDVSDRWLETLGYRREEVVGRRAVEFLTPASRRMARTKILPEFYRRGLATDVPYQMVKKNGEIIDVLLSASAHRDDSGRVLRSLTVITDVTQRKREQEELVRATARFEALFDSSPNPIASVTADGRFVRVNAAFERLTGCAAEELLRLRFTDITAVEHREKGARIMRRMVKGGAGMTFEKDYVRKDGSRVPVQITAFPVRAAGRLLGFAAICRDLTEEKRSEQAVRHLLSLHEATLESTADGILVVDTHGRIARYNKRFAEMWRIPASVLDSHDDRRSLKFVCGQLKDPRSFLKKVGALYDSPEAAGFDRLEFNDGRVFERYSQPQRIGDRIVGRVWSFRDVTERRRLEKEIAETSAREQAKIGRDLHDSIGQTLTAVALGLKALERADRRDPSADRALARLESLTRLAIQQVRDVARGLLPHELQAGDLGASLRALSVGARKMFGVPCEVSIRGDTRLRDNSSAVQLYRIAQEALNNAAKHARSSGGVRMSLDAGEKTLRLVVRDSGVGLPARRPAGAPGLGIAIMKHRAESLGGTVVVRRAVGGGTEVVCEVPRPGAPR